MSDTRTKIIDSAERRVRSGGYNGFSFREIASEIGIKSSSVHHHFPAKENLAVSVTKRYSEAFFEELGEPVYPKATFERQIKRYGSVFKIAYESSGRACLCGVLSNEADLLPDSVKTAVIEFVEANIVWLEKVISHYGSEDQRGQAREIARVIYCSLEGAMGVAAISKDGTWVDDVASIVRNLI